MINPELLQIVKEKGLLLEKEIFEALSSVSDMNVVKKLLDNFENITGQ